MNLTIYLLSLRSTMLEIIALSCPQCRLASPWRGESVGRSWYPWGKQLCALLSIILMRCPDQECPQEMTDDQGIVNTRGDLIHCLALWAYLALVTIHGFIGLDVQTLEYGSQMSEAFPGHRGFCHRCDAYSLSLCNLQNVHTITTLPDEVNNFAS